MLVLAAELCIVSQSSIVARLELMLKYENTKIQIPLFKQILLAVAGSK